MVKKGLIKKGFVWFALAGCLAGQGTDLLAEQKNIAAGQKKIPADSLVMTVAGKPVLLDEFLFIAQKNSEVDLSDRKSVENYVELFKNFKLKVAEAEAKGLDKTKAFKDELDGYRAQLTASYLSDKAGEEAAVRAEYDRYGEVLELSHILFRLPKQTLSKDTVAVYEQAMQAYERIAQGADFDAVGAELSAADKAHIGYEYVRSFLPMQSVKAFENAAYAQPVGTVSKPVRTTMGFHLIKIHSRKPNPGKIRVAHILVPFAKDTAAQDTAAVLARAEELYQQAVAGEDFAELAKSFSADSGSAKRGGVLPVLGLGEMIEPFEKAAFALQQPGDISRPVKTRFGYHIIKLLEKKGLPPFEELQKGWSRRMAQGERNFEYYQAFDERMKREYGYRFYPEAYAELQALCNDYFPSDRAFYEKAKEMDKTLFHLNGTDFPQNEFAYYIQRCPFSTKSYAGDFMQEVYDLFIRDIVTTAERKNLTMKHPEFNHLMQEYRDGMLLFEISNREVWDKPAAEQAKAEADWLARLEKEYPVTINWKVVKKITKQAKNKKE